jgi:hypothetical protein
MNANSSWHDPVVAEIHATRERLANQYHNDLFAYSKAAEERCRAWGLTMAEDQHSHSLPSSSDTRSPNKSPATRP